jgi:uracil permease
MKLIYDVEDRPQFKHLVVYALQQLLAIIAATLLVPTIINNAQSTLYMDPAAALFGAGIGTIVYVLFTKKKSPVFLGSSFAFISPLIGACAFGFWGIIIGALIAGSVYVIIALIIKFVGTGWVNKLLPAVIIGPTVALIGLSLAGSAVSNLVKSVNIDYNLIAILCGLVTFGVTILASVKGNKSMKLIPFVIGIGAGYVLASIFSIFGYAFSVDYLKIVDFSALVNNFAPCTFSSFFAVPQFTFLGSVSGLTGTGIGQIALLYGPVAFVVLAEHIADHKNLSSVIGRDLIENPGLTRTLLGDGVGSMVGALFGGCPNTTYGESIGCVAITKNASVWTIIVAACMAIVLAFFSPFVALVNTIPTCVLGGICLALYGFIAVSGLNMLKEVDLNNSKNLFIVSIILVAGIGGLEFNFGPITITGIATALILGILTNLILGKKKDKKVEEVVTEEVKTEE